MRISSIKLDNGKIIKTDCLAVSGGFNPNLHLTCHQRGRPKWDELNHCFIPNNPPKNMSVIGAANGIFNYQDIFKDSQIKLTKILQNLGHKKVSIEEKKLELLREKNKKKKGKGQRLRTNMGSYIYM